MKKDTKVNKRKHPVRNGILLGLAALLVIFVGYQLISGYIDTLPKLTYAYGKTVMPVKYPECRFAVISDVHYYDQSLGIEGEAFQDYLDYDRKLLRESSELLTLSIDRVLESGAQFVLVSGDLTKDGERLNHEQVAKALSRFTERGIQVYVVPGNHDVNNYGSYRYEGGSKTSVPAVSAAEFASIYGDFGYEDAVLRDSDTLSYVAEPVQGLWLVSLDACRYGENKPDEESIVGGRFTQAQITWLEGVLKQANESGKAVITMMHHGVVEHWKGQESLHPDFLVEDYRYVAEMLASWGVRLVFTGHYHAQDVAMADFGGKGFLLDVETGSLVTTPCPIRLCSIEGNQRFNYASQHLAPALRPGTDFVQYSMTYLTESVENQAFDTLRGYYVGEADARVIAASVAAAFAAHYAGDEDPANALPIDEGKLGLWSRVVLATQRYVLDGLWNDPSIVADGEGSVNLVSGK